MFVLTTLTTMKKSFSLLIALVMVQSAMATGHILHDHDSDQKRFITNNKSLPDQAYQQQLRNDVKWTQFQQTHGDWWVQFNETNGKPHRAFGEPVTIGINSSPSAAALYFLNTYAAAYLPNNIQLEMISAPSTKKYVQPNFIQRYNGLEVLWSRATVMLTPDLKKAIMFGLDVYDDIAISTTPTISSLQAITAASTGLSSTVVASSAGSALKILPIPSYRHNDYKLVYEIAVRTTGDGVTPDDYYTLVDANTGEVLYRKDKIVSFAVSDIVVNATIYPTHPYNPTTVVNLPYLQVTIGATNFNTDVNGLLNVTGVPAPFTATFSLQSPYATVLTGASGNIAPFFTATIADGSNTISFDPNTTIQHLTAFYHTNIVHDFMKNYLTSFTGLDNQMPVRVERTDGNCNAFYDGNGINFYTTSNGCYALSLVSDVVYHEYGHAITNQFWADNGLNFSNGAMGEGYSDIWAISITNNPVLGIGFSDTDPTSFVRNYDFANGVSRKVYPQNIVGQVHGDGEIIAGAWWSTNLLLGSLSTTTNIFAESHLGLANGPNGAEGQVYTDILIDALFADDNDANLSNGTPNAGPISQGFALHGITLLSNATLVHTPVATSAANNTITLNASLTNVTFAWALSGVKGAYKTNTSTVWNPITFSNTGGNNYSTTIPAQPAGTVVGYYIGIEDVNGTLSNVQPQAANITANPNIPYFILVGFNKIFTEDFDVTGGPWVEGAPGDLATTGMWEQYIPEQTDITGAVVQPNYQVTPGGLICYVTGGQSGGAGNAGAYDVDGGKTTLTSPVFDLTSYTNPTIEYYRWYSNDQGATPGTDFWQVFISNDGVNYVPVENTNVADHSWRNFVFRINDYLPSTSTFTVRFVAEDANAGSLIEALMDEFSLYDGPSTTALNEINDLTAVYVWPNPASTVMNLSTVVKNAGDYTVQITDQTGRLLLSSQNSFMAGKNDLQLPVNKLASGMYQLQLIGKNGSKTIKFSVLN